MMKRHWKFGSFCIDADIFTPDSAHLVFTMLEEIISIMFEDS